MRLPSAERLARDTVETVRRFPLPVLAALVASGILLRAIETGDGLEPLAPVALGIPLFAALRLAGERGVLPRMAEALLSLGTLAGLAWLHRSWGDWGESLRLVRYAQLFAGAFLLLAVLPYARPLRGGDGGLLPFNRHLLLRAVEGVLQAAVLLAGISAALVAVDQLFGVSVSHRAYQRLAVLLGFVVFPLYVLAGIRFDPPEEHPRPLRVVGQYLLVPLSALYLAILTAYLAQVLLTRSWPSGWIGWLVSWMAVVGTFSIFLVRPEGGREPRWARRWERAFWTLMLPASGMLLAAVGKRVGQYGVTEPRYLALALGGWLLAMAVAFGILRVRDFRVLPGTLACLLLLTLAGPWGVASVSRSSQVDRLAGLFAAHGMLEDGQVVPARTPVPEAEAREVVQILRYLYRTHPAHDLGPILGPYQDEGAWRGEGPPPWRQETPPRWAADTRAEAVARALGLDPGTASALDPRGAVTLALDGAGIHVEGFRRLAFVPVGGELVLGGVTWRVGIGEEGTRLQLTGSGGERVLFDLRPLLEGAGPGVRIERTSTALSVDPAPGGAPLPDGVRVRLVVRELVYLPSRDGAGFVTFSVDPAWLVVD